MQKMFFSLALGACLLAGNPLSGQMAADQLPARTKSEAASEAEAKSTSRPASIVRKHPLAAGRAKQRPEPDYRQRGKQRLSSPSYKNRKPDLLRAQRARRLDRRTHEVRRMTTPRYKNRRAKTRVRG